MTLILTRNKVSSVSVYWLEVYVSVSLHSNGPSCRQKTLAAGHTLCLCSLWVSQGSLFHWAKVIIHLLMIHLFPAITGQPACIAALSSESKIEEMCKISLHLTLDPSVKSPYQKPAAPLVGQSLI